MTSPLILTSKRFLGLVKESTYGTPVTTGVHWLPVKNPKVTPTTKFEMDQALRGIAAQDFGAYQGVQSCDFSYTLPWFVVDTPEILTAILGPDSVTGTASPYTHTMSLASGEPTSLTLHDYDGVDQFEIAGGALSEATFKIDSEGALTCDIKGSGFFPATETESSPSYETNAYYLGWQGAVTLNSLTNSNLVNAEISLKRKLTKRWAVTNSQQLRYAWVGPLSVSVKATFDCVDDTEYSLYKNNTQGNLNIIFTNPTTTSYTFALNMPKCAFTTGEKTSGKDWLQTSLSGTAIYSSSVSGPIQAIINNSLATSY